MKKDTFQLRVFKPAQESSRPIVRLSDEAYAKASEVKNATGLSLTKIISDAVEFAIDRLEVIYTPNDSE